MKTKEKENIRVENLYQCTSFVYSCCEWVDYLWYILSFYPRNEPEDQNLSQTFLIWEMTPWSMGSRKVEWKRKEKEAIKCALSCRIPLWATGFNPQRNSGKLCRRYLRMAPHQVGEFAVILVTNSLSLFESYLWKKGKTANSPAWLASPAYG